MLHNDDLIKWYLNTKGVKNLKVINTKRQFSTLTNHIIDSNYNKMEDTYFKLMPFSNLSSKNYHITFEESGTAFIKQIFKKEVDKDTLVISTKYEHDSVINELNKCKNTLLLNYNNDILQKGHTLTSIVDKAKQYKKVFIYIIGTQFATGQIIPQSYLISLKEQLIRANVKHKILLDDVHGMFIVPRDYSLFDYVLYTAHAIIPEFEMGLLISKEGRYGYKAYEWGMEYLPKIKTLLKDKEALFQFKSIMLNYFASLLSWPNISTYDYSVNHIFTLHTENLYFSDEEYNELSKYNITISDKHNSDNFIRFRFQEFALKNIDEALTGLSLAKKILIRAITMAKLKGE